MIGSRTEDWFNFGLTSLMNCGSEKNKLQSINSNLTAFCNFYTCYIIKVLMQLPLFSNSLYLLQKSPALKVRNSLTNVFKKNIDSSSHVINKSTWVWMFFFLLNISFFVVNLPPPSAQPSFSKATTILKRLDRKIEEHPVFPAQSGSGKRLPSSSLLWLSLSACRFLLLLLLVSYWRSDTLTVSAQWQNMSSHVCRPLFQRLQYPSL